MRKLKNVLNFDHHYASLQDFAEHLNILGLAESTMQAYYRNIGLLARYFKCDPATITERQMRAYIAYMRVHKKWSAKTIRQNIASAKRFFCHMLGHEWNLWNMASAPDPKTLPAVLDKDEVEAIFQCFDRQRYKVPLQLIFCCGLRLGEALSITVDDTRDKENRLFIRSGKGRKDRFVPLPSVMSKALQRYWLHHQNPKWFFPRVGQGQADSKSVAKRMAKATESMDYGSVQRAFRQALKKSKVKKQATVHTLRHSYATNLLIDKVDPRQIQTYLGHNSLETTMRYLHLVPRHEEHTLQIIENLAKKVF